MTTRPDLSALFDASPYPYLLIDTGFVIIGANPSYLHATGRTAADIIGKHIFDAFPVNPADHDSTNLNEVHRSIELAIATQKPHTSALLRYAIPRETPLGTVFDERYWSAIHTPVLNEAGAVAFVAQNAIDVTDLYRFDVSSSKYFLKLDASAVPDVAHMSRPQMHEAMTRILNAERSQLKVLFDQAPGFIAVLTGKDQTFEIVNEAYYQLVGHRELIGKRVLEALPELAVQGFDKLLDGVFQTAEPIVLRERKVALQRTAVGPLQDRYVDLLFQPIVGEDGLVTGILVQGSDVTGAHEASRALSEKMQQLEEIRSSQAFLLEVADRICPLNDPDDITAAACALLGQKLSASRVTYSEIDDINDTVFIRPDWTAKGFDSLRGHAQAINVFGSEVIATLRSGEPVMRNDIQAELHLPLVKDGKLRAALTINSVKPRLWQGRELELAQQLAERTWSAIEAAYAQAALRAERDQSQYIFDSMAEGFAVLNRNWIIMSMNAEGLRLTQRTADEVVGRDHWDVWPELKGTEVEPTYRKVMETGKTQLIEMHHTLPDQSHVWIEVRTHRSLNGGIAFFFRDVTERRLAQDQLKIADQRKDEFLAMLAHELRNPLAPIGAAAQLLQTAKLDEARVRHTSQIIGRQVDHMTHLINDLLDVSRVTRGQVVLDNAPQDISHIVAEAAEQVAPLMQLREHNLSLLLPPDLTMVMGDRKRLVQVITNILTNAAKYTDEGGNIILETEVHESHVLISVIDNGVGMSLDLSAHAFDLFAQAERTSDRSAGGLGLGLALVRSLVELHRGTVTCHSQGIGRGSKFTVCLPRLLVEGARQEHSSDHNSMLNSSSSLRILLVDDNVDAATMLAMLLEAAGHRVAVEHTARAGLMRAQAQAPQVCLLDIGLPEIDGNELARQLRLLPQTAEAVLIAVTGYGQESDRQRTQSAGFNHHLVKPVDTQQLFAILEPLQ